MAESLIVSDPEVLGGKPCVRGTRLSVEFLLELAASGGTRRRFWANILSSRPTACQQRSGTPPMC